MIKEIVCISFMVILSLPVSGQIGAGYEPVQQPQVEYQYRQPTAYEMQLELQRRQALYDRNYRYVLRLRENVNELIRNTDEAQFHHEMYAAQNRLDYLLGRDLSLLTDEINKVQKSIGKSVKWYNKRVDKINRKRDRIKKRNDRRVKKINRKRDRMKKKNDR